MRFDVSSRYCASSAPSSSPTNPTESENLAVPSTGSANAMPMADVPMTDVPMTYVSTRGRAPELDFADVLLAGLATDGGLYVPRSWPQLDLSSLQGLPYADVAVQVMWPFVAGSIERDRFEQIVADAYSTFVDDDVVPVRSLGDRLWLAEIFHGPTLAFKDIALQLVGRLFNEVLARRSSRVTVLGATSGDTGSAAIDGLANSPYVDVVILFPHGRVSEVQRRQMTTVTAPNVHAVAVDGTFDDCQDLVKAAFADVEFRDGVGLSAVNSINWARVMAQIVYYVTSSLHVAAASGDDSAPSFVVPTGNFGNIFAGWVAKQMGLPVNRLVIASNSNDILTRFFTSSTMAMEDVVATSSPSMDIQVSSNLERLLFEAHDRNGAVVGEMLSAFRRDGTVTVSPEVHARLTAEFDCGSLNESDVDDVMARYWSQQHVLLDPHTAVGVGVAERFIQTHPTGPVISLSTAHPAKFSAAVEAATGQHPPLPTHLADLLERPERVHRAPNDLAAVKDLVHELREA